MVGAAHLCEEGEKEKKSLRVWESKKGILLFPCRPSDNVEQRELMVNEQQLLLFLLQVLLLLGLARSCGEVLRRLGYPPLVGEILVGIILGPTLFGRVLPDVQQTLFPPDPLQRTMLETVSWFGVLFLLLETGLEVDLSAAWRQRGPALKVGIIGVILPLLFGFVLSAGLLPDRYLGDSTQRVTFALFLSTTMAISAIAVMARVLHDLDLLKSDLGLLTLCGYAVNDVLAWVIFSVLLALTVHSTLAISSIAFVFIATIVFTTGCLTLGRRLVDRAINALNLSLPQQPGAILTFVCCLGLCCGVVTQWIGLNALFGFFLAGIMAGEARALSERTRQIISQMVHALFVPLYFAGVGLRLDFFANFDFLLVLFVVVVSVVGKFVGAWTGVLGTELSRADRLSVAIAFTPGGMTEIILAQLALGFHIFTPPVFVAIVIAALVSSLIVGPWLAWSIRRRRQVQIAELFLPRAMIPQLRGTTRRAVIEDLCQAVAEHDRMPDREALVTAVCAREELMGTGIGEGVAIPHARIDGLAKPVLTLGRSTQGVDWDCPDGLPAHLIFLLLTPAGANDVQLEILAALARALGSEDARGRLRHATNGHDVWMVLHDILRPRVQPDTSGSLPGRSMASTL